MKDRDNQGRGVCSSGAIVGIFFDFCRFARPPASLAFVDPNRAYFRPRSAVLLVISSTVEIEARPSAHGATATRLYASWPNPWRPALAASLKARWEEVLSNVSRN